MNYIAQTVFTSNDLQHYGIRGMRWGQRKAPTTNSSGTRSNSNSTFKKRLGTAAKIAGATALAGAAAYGGYKLSKNQNVRRNMSNAAFNIKSGASSAYGKARSAASKYGSKAKSGASNAYSKAKAGASKYGSMAKSSATNAYGKAKTGARNMAVANQIKVGVAKDYARTTGVRALQNASSKVRNGATRVSGTAKKYGSTVKSTASRAGSSVRSSAKKYGNTVRSTASRAGSSIKSRAKSTRAAVGIYAKSSNVATALRNRRRR